MKLRNFLIMTQRFTSLMMTHSHCRSKWSIVRIMSCEYLNCMSCRSFNHTYLLSFVLSISVISKGLSKRCLISFQVRLRLSESVSIYFSYEVRNEKHQSSQYRNYNFSAFLYGCEICSLTAKMFNNRALRLIFGIK